MGRGRRVRKGFFEGLELGAEYEPAALDDARDRRLHVGRILPRTQLQEGNHAVSTYSAMWAREYSMVRRNPSPSGTDGFQPVVRENFDESEEKLPMSMRFLSS